MMARARLDRRQRRSGQFLHAARQLRRRAARRWQRHKWCNEQFDALIQKAAALTDQAERAKLYEQAQVIMHDEAPFFLIAHSVVSSRCART